MYLGNRQVEGLRVQGLRVLGRLGVLGSGAQGVGTFWGFDFRGLGV